MSTGRIVIHYPPDYDGELHVEYDTGLTPGVSPGFEYKFTFTHAAVGNAIQTHGERAWETLVAAARGILAQEERRKKIHEDSKIPLNDHVGEE